MPKRKERKELGMRRFVNLMETEAKATKFIENARWPNGIECPSCSEKDNITKHKKRFGSYWCKKCRNRFSTKTNTTFKHMKISNTTFLDALYLMFDHRSYISAPRLAVELEITEKAAWNLQKDIRKSIKFLLKRPMMKGIIEIDETYIGGKERNKHFYKKARNAPYSQKKQILLGLKERGPNGEVRIFRIDNADKATIQKIIRSNVEPGATIYTDEAPAYKGLEKWYEHDFVKHKNRGYRGYGGYGEYRGYGEYVKYVNGKRVSTNEIESVWNKFKGKIISEYVSISKEHLQSYADLFCFKWNERAKGYTRLQTIENFIRLSENRKVRTMHETRGEELFIMVVASRASPIKMKYATVIDRAIRNYILVSTTHRKL